MMNWRGIWKESKRIRGRAYEMWEEQGQPRGLHIDHWISAERVAEAAKARSAFGKKVPGLERVT